MQVSFRTEKAGNLFSDAIIAWIAIFCVQIQLGKLLTEGDASAHALAIRVAAKGAVCPLIQYDLKLIGDPEEQFPVHDIIQVLTHITTDAVEGMAGVEGAHLVQAPIAGGDEGEIAGGMGQAGWMVPALPVPFHPGNESPRQSRRNRVGLIFLSSKLKCTGQITVITAEEGDQIACAMFETLVDRMALPTVFSEPSKPADLDKIG